MTKIERKHIYPDSFEDVNIYHVINHVLFLHQLKQKLVYDTQSAQQAQGKERKRCVTKTTKSAHPPHHYNGFVATLPTLDDLWRT